MMSFEDTLGDMGELLAGVANSTEGSKGSNTASSELDIDLILDNPAQPRRTISSESIDELAKTIIKYGVLQPIVVKQSSQKKGYYELIAGQRRILASKKAGLKTIPFVEKNVSSQDSAALAIIENIQKEDLPPMEEALSFSHLITKYNITQKELADNIGKDDKYVGRMLALLSLPDIIRTAFENGSINSPQATIELKKAFEKDEQATAEFIADNNEITYKQANEFYKSIRDGQSLSINKDVQQPANPTEYETTKTKADHSSETDYDDPHDDIPTNEIDFDYKEQANPSEVSIKEPSEPDSRDPNKLHKIEAISAILEHLEESSIRDVAETIILRLREDDVERLINTLETLSDAEVGDLSETIIARFS
jgi:ParB family chromosome partitioning protein